MMATIPKKEKSASNPFGNLLLYVVAFACVACASAGLALAFGAAYFGNGQKWFLIVFLFFFPFFGVGVISWLVLRHATKLIVESANTQILWETVSASVQKTNLNHEVNQLAKIMKIPSSQLSDLRSAYIVGEDLAMRKIQEETKIPLFRNVTVGNNDFTAIYLEGDYLTCIQMTFVVSAEVKQEQINKILKKASKARTFINGKSEGTRVRLLLVLVTQLDRDSEAKLRSSLVSKFSNTPVDVDIRLLDFQGLQALYSEA